MTLRAPLAITLAVLAAGLGAAPALAQDNEADPYSAPAVITVSKASDALGAPIELRPRVNPALTTTGPISRPDRLPLTTRAALTSRFGMRGHPILGGRRMHSGVDLAAPTGSPVVTPADGIVSFANWRGGYGLLVTVEHGGGLQTRFGHLSRVMVAPGQRVTRGQLLGLVGSTGRSTGAHLHYEMRRNGLAIDPLAAR
jgi:murein DD-endopeptidase MepM/ murein hydrolase activator NlpD